MWLCASYQKVEMTLLLDLFPKSLVPLLILLV